uniref:Uncharacterized protein n=1 Tax=Arundo donax TaxID=35708 RepID=A0A0A9E166_ARUDO
MVFNFELKKILHIRNSNS